MGFGFPSAPRRKASTAAATKEEAAEAAGFGSSEKRGGPASGAASTFWGEKSERPVNRLADADPSRSNQVRPRRPRKHLDHSPPHLTSIERPIDPKGLTQLTGPVCQRPIGNFPASGSGNVDPFIKFESPDQHGGANTDRANDQVRAPVDAVRPVDVPRSRTPVDGGVSGIPAPLVGVGSRVLKPEIGLRLDDPAADHPASDRGNDNRSDQFWAYLLGRAIKEPIWKRGQATFAVRARPRRGWPRAALGALATTTGAGATGGALAAAPPLARPGRAFTAALAGLSTVG